MSYYNTLSIDSNNIYNSSSFPLFSVDWMMVVMVSNFVFQAMTLILIII
jgi:hypothetical protein